MKLFNIIKSVALSVLLLAGASTVSAQVPTYVKAPDTITDTSGFFKTLFVDLNNDGRDDFVTISSTGFSANAPGTGLDYGVNPPVQKYSYGLLKVGVQLNQPDGSFGPSLETVLPLVTELGRGGVGNRLGFRIIGVQIAKLTPGSNNFGLIFTGVASSVGVDLNDYTRSIDMQNSATLASNGDGTFRTPVITSGFIASGGTPADLAGVGYHAQYLKIKNNINGGSTITIHGLNPDGTFTINALSEVQPQTNGNDVFLILKDLNNDGKDDVVLKTYSGDQIVNNGDGNSYIPYYNHSIFFGGGSILSPVLTKSFSFPSATIADGSLVLGDFNGDGFIDFLEIFPGATRLYINDGYGNPSSAAVINDSALIGLRSTYFVQAAADLDGDGKDDLVASYARGTLVPQFYKSNGNGTFQARQPLDIPDAGPGESSTSVTLINIGSKGIPSFVRFAVLSDPFANIYNAKYEFYQNTLDVSVNSTTTLAINPTVPIVGQSTTFTATVTGMKPGGVVNFTDGATSLGSAPLVNGKATLALPAGLTSGAHTVTASFPSDFRNKASSASSTITIAPIATALPKFTSISNPTVKEGQKATFVLTLSAATNQAASVKLTLINGTATSGLDFSTAMSYSDDGGWTYQDITSGGMANIPVGVTSFLVRVTTLKDAIEEPSETYQLVVNPVSGLASNVGMGTGTILDKSKKEKSLFDQVRGVADSASKTAESFTTRIINSWMVKSFSGLFSWR